MLIKIILWVLAGFLICKLMKIEQTQELIFTILLGVVGGLIVSFIFALITQISIDSLLNIIVSIAGACLAVWLAKKFDVGRLFRK